MFLNLLPLSEEGSNPLVSSVKDFALEHWMDAVMVVVLFFAMTIVASWVSRIIRGACERAKVEITLSHFFGRLGRTAVMVIGVVIILGKFGIETSSFAAILAAMGFAIGMAMQGTLGNFASGVMLLIFRPFKVGDVINAAGVVGKVSMIDLFTTVVDTPDNRRIIVPNGAIFGGTIENISHHDTRRIEVAVGTDYGADLDKVREVLDKAVAKVETRIDEPGHQIVLAGLGDSCIDWKVRVWCKSTDYLGCMEETTRIIKYALDEAGIGIPFPQMDVHLDKLEG
ncbi:MAG: mechanosensitive ion channel [Planctomycetota bacterium]|nr:mechanosensitive ion channel [Planctomycetota bacterium]